MSRWPRAHVAIALLAAVALIVFATSTRPPHPAPQRRAEYVQVQGLTLRYVRAGAGPTVVLIHGYGESLVAWRAVFENLSPHADVIALDLPGFGLSSKQPGGYANDSLAATVAAALTALGVRQAVLVGHSLGGAVAVATALTAPSLVRALVLVDPAVVGAPMGLPDSLTGGGMRTAIAEYEAQRTRFNAPHDAQWLAESDSALDYLPAADSAYRVSAGAVLAQFDFAYLTPERARRLVQPALILWGEYDPVLPIAAGRALAASLPNARFQVIGRSWHRPQVERPAETARFIIDFLRAAPPPADSAP